MSRTFSTGSRRRVVLKSVSYAFEAGRMYAVVGLVRLRQDDAASLASGLDAPTAGRVRFKGRDVAELGLGTYRNRHVATVFQSPNLLTYMNAVQT
ncbi:hypothetical protein LV779_23615 [Streptomyces thinghirensis]|nr:hypothetical protein [Streptomyces thinghirensis]